MDGFIFESPIKMDDLGVPLFSEHLSGCDDFLIFFGYPPVNQRSLFAENPDKSELP